VPASVETLKLTTEYPASFQAVMAREDVLFNIWLQCGHLWTEWDGLGKHYRTGYELRMLDTIEIDGVPPDISDIDSDHGRVGTARCAQMYGSFIKSLRNAAATSNIEVIFNGSKMAKYEGSRLMRDSLAFRAA
jgi:hypothetical protein